MYEEIREQLGGEQKEHVWVLNAAVLACLDDEEDVGPVEEAAAMIANTIEAKKNKEIRK